VKSPGQHRYNSGDKKQQYPDLKMEFHALSPVMSAWLSEYTPTSIDYVYPSQSILVIME
jgi:hypothetical protein